MATDISTQTPSLHAGDRLTRAEFLNIWEQLPDLKRAELIGGVVYMPSPVGLDHAESEYDAAGWTFCYKIATPGTSGGSNATSILLEDAPQADVHLRLLPEYGGKTWVENKLLHGPPEMFVEVSHSSEAHDLNVKLPLYEEAGVQEYLVILLKRQEIRWHRLVDGKYQLLPADADGIWRSLVFPGLWLNGKAMLEGDSAQLAATLQDGIASEEHQRFVQKLADRKRKGTP